MNYLSRMPISADSLGKGDINDIDYYWTIGMFVHFLGYINPNY